MRNGLGTVWARCPLAAATTIAARKKVNIGWTVVRVELLQARPIQCFKCWGFGHVRFACTSSVDRSRSCFNCGKEGHSLRDCQLPSYCVVCAAEGKGSNHRLGSTLCEANRKPKRPRPGALKSTMLGRRKSNDNNTDNEL
ncbi:gag polyprotein [Lasius niger]|uniref:Gag polyprotein n=1 Tax=Lasius niger TaxID=67767 RepID=A0A0J7K206_LASNI|nr:gag polyprotein [Lasius niger]